MLQAKIRVLYARFLDFGEGKEAVKGTQVFFQLEGQEVEKGSVGFPITKAFVKDINVMNLIPHVGLYEATLEPKITGGKIEMRLHGIGKPVEVGKV